MANVNRDAADSELTGRDSVSLEDLVVLNDEIAAAVRAGLPIDSGWQQFGSRLPGRLSGLTDRLAERMRSGASLAEAVSAERENLPGVYRAIVETGLRSGRLADALQSFSALAKSEIELRQQVRLAFIYPCVVAALAYVLLVAFMYFIVPQFLAVIQTFQLPPDAFISALGTLGETVMYWGPALPAAALLMLAAAALRRESWTGKPPRRIRGRLHRRAPVFSRILGLSRVMRDEQHALLCDMMGLLLEHGVPLPESFRLAGDTTGNADLIGAAHAVASGLETGAPLADAMSGEQPFPAYMRWQMHVALLQGHLSGAMRQLAGYYRSRAMRRAEWCRLLLPVVAMAIVAGGITALYALTLFIPVTRMLYEMGGV